MDLTSHLIRTNKLWTAFQHLQSKTVAVSTVWPAIDDDSTASTARHEVVEEAKLSPWLLADQGSSHQMPGPPVVRMVWVEYNSAQKTVRMSENNLKRILVTFGLERALQVTFTTYAGALQLPQFSDSGSDNSSVYCFGIHPKLIMLWSHDVARNRIQGMVFASQQQIDQFKALLELHWSQPTAILPLACATLLSTEIDRTQEWAKQRIGMVEVRTGYHNWKSRTENPATGDLGTISAQMSGVASKMASVSRKTNVIEQLLRLAKDDLASTAPQEPWGLHDHDVRLIEHRIAMHKLDTEFIRTRAEIQVAAVSCREIYQSYAKVFQLFNLITQNDAIASHAVAKQSKIVATASQRDSTSMKTLAVVTILFLPSQVVASIFAMPVFSFSAPQPANANGQATGTGRYFGLYWAISIPLTLFTLVAAGLWLLFERHNHKQSVEAVERQNSDAPIGPEVGVVLRRRTTAETFLSK